MHTGLAEALSQELHAGLIRRQLIRLAGPHDANGELDSRHHGREYYQVSPFFLSDITGPGRAARLVGNTLNKKESALCSGGQKTMQKIIFMSQNNNLQPTSDASGIKNLELIELQRPLIKALNGYVNLPTSSGFDFDYAFIGFDREVLEDEALILTCISGDEKALRAVATLLHITASADKGFSGGVKGMEHLWSPTHYSLLKRVYSVKKDDNMQYIHCYLPNCNDPSVKLRAAQQAEHLAAYLSNPDNILNFTAEELARL